MPYKVHCHVKPCGLTNAKPLDFECDCDGDISIGELKEKISELAKIPKSLMVLYHPSVRRVGGGEEALHDYDKVDMKLKTSGHAGLRECDVYGELAGFSVKSRAQALDVIEARAQLCRSFLLPTCSG
jgi:hypothetical protein